MPATHIDGAATAPPTRCVLPPGRDNVLMPPSRGRDGTIAGQYLFHGRPLRLETDGDGTTLFPTDVGLSLLAALNHEAVLNVTGAQVLDVGCGSGLYTVAMLLAGADTVTALDINPACVSTTIDNAARNNLNVSQVKSLCADLTTLVVEQPWDMVVCNPPHLPHDPMYAGDGGLQAALVGGTDGRALYDILLARLDELLVSHGTGCAGPLVADRYPPDSLGTGCCGL